MQFVTNGPEIPNELLHAHEEGRVVFFCGAGISYPAGLKGFDWLVNELVLRLGINISPLITKALKIQRYDIALDLLERDYPGDRFSVRRELIDILKPDLTKKRALDTHKALLELSSSKEGMFHLVTTNFDWLFEEAAKKHERTLNTYSAPLLPIPKNSKWNGLVYLHGSLPEKPEMQALNRIVLTSGDFGLAYISERWASRFVSELFRNYVVCFVGYGINDPVLRYMMDALAADKMMGEDTREAYAFCSYKSGNENIVVTEWSAKGVIPILYKNTTHHRNHKLLHDTLIKWAELHHDGVIGVERIIIDNALAKPSESTIEDNFVGKVLWALTHKSGLPAKRFAVLNPVPPLEWLEVISDPIFGHNDFHDFEITATSKGINEKKYSLLERPLPISLSSNMSLFSDSQYANDWDVVMDNITNWLIRHLNNPELFLWFVKKGRPLHPRLVQKIESCLNKVNKNQNSSVIHKENADGEAQRDEIPGPVMISLWRLVIAGKVFSKIDNLQIYNWLENIKDEGFSQYMKFELRDFLAPVVIFREKFNLKQNHTLINDINEISQLFSWELTLSSKHAYSALHNKSDSWWRETLPHLFFDFQQLLADGLLLQHYIIGQSSQEIDNSIFDMPSITPHEQNREYHEWVLLIELVRDSWLALKEQDRTKAKRIAEEWFDSPFIVFKRLALFAASNDGIVPPQTWVEWLLLDNRKSLWSMNTRREVMRLFVLQGNKLSDKDKQKLENGIIKGPPIQEKNTAEAKKDSDRAILLRLAKLQSSGIMLSESVKSKYELLTSNNPGFNLANNDRDEFFIWMFSERESTWGYKPGSSSIPRKRSELIEWIKDNWNNTEIINRDWRRHSLKYPANVGFALFDSIECNDYLPINLLSEAFYAWSGKEVLCSRTWKWFSPCLNQFSDDLLLKIAKPISYWLEKISKTNFDQDKILLGICKRFLELPLDHSTGIIQNGEPLDQPVSEAINHPIGQVTEALIAMWFKGNPKDNDKLPEEFKTIFSQMCNTEILRFRHGRVILASQIIALYRVDREWGKEKLLPLFDWSINPKEARAVWEGFFWSLRIYEPLISELEPFIVDTVEHYNELDEFGQNFARFITIVAVDLPEIFTSKTLRTIFEKLPEKGLLEAIDVLRQMLEVAQKKSGELWKHRVNPFWNQIWPKLKEMITDKISEHVSDLCILSGGQFESALKTLKPWLSSVDYPEFIIKQLSESGLCERFPNTSLDFLDVVVGHKLMQAKYLKKCLDDIKTANSSFVSDSRFKRLFDLIRLLSDVAD